MAKTVNIRECGGDCEDCKLLCRPKLCKEERRRQKPPRHLLYLQNRKPIKEKRLVPA